MLPRGRLFPVFFFCVWFGLGFPVLFLPRVRCSVWLSLSLFNIWSMPGCSVFSVLSTALKILPLFISHLLPASADCLQLRLALSPTNPLPSPCCQHPDSATPKWVFSFRVPQYTSAFMSQYLGTNLQHVKSLWFLTASQTAFIVGVPLTPFKNFL